MAALTKSTRYPAGCSPVGYTITPANGLGSNVKSVGKAGVAAAAQQDTTQQSATTIATNKPLATDPVLNYVRNEDDATYRGRSAGYSIKG